VRLLAKCLALRTVTTMIVRRAVLVVLVVALAAALVIPLVVLQRQLEGVIGEPGSVPATLSAIAASRAGDHGRDLDAQRALTSVGRVTLADGTEALADTSGDGRCWVLTAGSSTPSPTSEPVCTDTAQ
jgi:hypothetical protein